MIAAREAQDAAARTAGMAPVVPTSVISGPRYPSEVSQREAVPAQFNVDENLGDSGGISDGCQQEEEVHVPRQVEIEVSMRASAESRAGPGMLTVSAQNEDPVAGVYAKKLETTMRELSGWDRDRLLGVAPAIWPDRLREAASRTPPQGDLYYISDKRWGSVLGAFADAEGRACSIFDE
ncbi:hypothetical protein BDK51DRAFT_29995 [Blyttiomyces helicus]|uniref:Uncharacterized protein n=1 Tax=Blyttiomyces helicus TaxID=388810 RepID=A0A4P9WN67_9FUNG|nr:hypothetical protein BDK51DRAFT_29995 [Blyttiomyces helicus]|eukprot:RKO93503.1 hypothetical protein BDK51DRAFT_29995 [Blyttiomyces helicus]